MPPRLSLWLLPPASAGISKRLADIIASQIPSLFNNIDLPSFAPHITLAAGIEKSFPDNGSAQTWLTSLDLTNISVNDVRIVFNGVDTGITFTKKCYLRAHRTPEFERLAQRLHMQIFGSIDSEAMQWANEKWDPHLSLLYWDGQVPDVTLEEIRSVLCKYSIHITNDADQEAAWLGGIIQLVDTSKPVEQWTVLAERILK